MHPRKKLRLRFCTDEKEKDEEKESLRFSKDEGKIRRMHPRKKGVVL